MGISSHPDVALAVKAIEQVVGEFKVHWYEEPIEGWDGALAPDVECLCKSACFCCDPTSVTRQQVEALRRIGVRVNDGCAS